MKTEKTCRTCAAYVPQAAGSRSGSCRANAPTAIMVGVNQQPSMPGVNGAIPQKMATPIVQGYFPPVGEACWCMAWRAPDPEQDVAIQTEDAAA